MRHTLLTVLAVWSVGAGVWFGAPVARAAEPAAGAAEGAGTVSVSLEAADLRAVVTALARAHNINLVGSDKLTGTVTLHLTDAPVFEALTIILNNAGFALVKKDNGMYEILTEAESLRSGSLSTVRVFTLKFAEVAQVAKLLVPNAIPTAERVAQNPATNQLILSGTDEELAKAEQIIEAVDKPLPQVVIQARIIEIFTDKARSLGIRFNVTGVSNKLGDNGEMDLGFDVMQNPVEAATFDFTFLSDRVDAAISALTQQEVAEILSAPRVTTGHGLSAEFRVVNQEPVITRTTRIVDGVTVTDETVTFKDTGVTLTVTPRVLADDRIEMLVEPSVLELVGLTDTDPPVPIINTRTARTQVTIEDGKWLVIGGLIGYRERELERGVPLLKDIPGLGWFFRTKYRTREKSDLIIFLTASVLDTQRIEDDTAARQSAIQKHRREHGLEGGPFPPPDSDGGPETPPAPATEDEGRDELAAQREPE